jgi:hypothetical protein
MKQARDEIHENFNDFFLYYYYCDENFNDFFLYYYCEWECLFSWKNIGHVLKHASILNSSVIVAHSSRKAQLKEKVQKTK